MAPNARGKGGQTGDALSPATNRTTTSTRINGTGTGQSRSPALSRTSSARPSRAGRPSLQTANTRGSEKAVELDTQADPVVADNAALLQELRASLAKAEAASNEYQRQLHSLQIRLDEAAGSQTRLEDDLEEKNSRVEVLENAQSQSSRRSKELEHALQIEQEAMLAEKSSWQAVEAEMQATIRRLKDNLRERPTPHHVKGNAILLIHWKILTGRRHRSTDKNAWSYAE